MIGIWLGKVRAMMISALYGLDYLMIICWIIETLKVVELKNRGHFVTVILSIDYDCMVNLSIRSLEIGYLALKRLCVDQ